MIQDNQPSLENQIELSAFPTELQQIIRKEQIDPSFFHMMYEIYNNSNEEVLAVWERLPKSAQNILDNYMKFHALATLAQLYSGIDFLEQMQDQQIEKMTEKESEEYKNYLLGQVLAVSVSDLGKMLKKARLAPSIKRQYREVFIN